MKLHRLIIIVFLFFSLSVISQNNPTRNVKKVNKVVIDAGHGGHDPGAVGRKAKEKDIVLDVSLMAGKMIKDNVPGVEVHYTRDKDVFVELFRRAQIANELHADLFISIHCNAARRRDARGTEVFVMGLDKSEQNLEIAKKENASILLEDNYEARYEGINPNSSEAYIVFSLFQNSFLDQSLNFAAKSMNAFNKNLGLVNRGVKQAPFLVLWRATMPSVLVEIGFISNPDEEDFLIKKENKEKVAYSIYSAFVEYKNEVEGTKIPIVDFAKAVNRPNATLTPVSSSNTQIQASSTTPNPNSANLVLEIPNNNDDNVVFKVQLFIDRNKLATTNSRFKGLDDLNYYFDAGVFKYVSGQASNFDEATVLLENVRSKGFADAFIVAFKNGKRISNKEARDATDNSAN